MAAPADSPWVRHWISCCATEVTEAAAVELEDEVFQVTIERTGEDSMVRVKAQSFGGTDFTIRDGETEYRYALKVYEDETGHTQIRITEADGD